MAHLRGWYISCGLNSRVAGLPRPAGAPAIKEHNQLFQISLAGMEAVGRAQRTGCFAAGRDRLPGILSESRKRKEAKGEAHKDGRQAERHEKTSSNLRQETRPFP